MSFRAQSSSENRYQEILFSHLLFAVIVVPKYRNFQSFQSLESLFESPKVLVRAFSLKFFCFEFFSSDYSQEFVTSLLLWHKLRRIDDKTNAIKWLKAIRISGTTGSALGSSVSLLFIPLVLNGIMRSEVAICDNTSQCCPLVVIALLLVVIAGIDCFLTMLCLIAVNRRHDNNGQLLVGHDWTAGGVDHNYEISSLRQCNSLWAAFQFGLSGQKSDQTKYSPIGGNDQMCVRLRPFQLQELRLLLRVLRRGKTSWSNR